jgi:hypothetical protein
MTKNGISDCTIGIVYLPTFCCRPLFYFLSKGEVARIYVGLEKVSICCDIMLNSRA